MSKYKMLTLMAGIPVVLAIILLSLRTLDGVIFLALEGMVLIPAYILGTILLALLKKTEAATAMAWSVGIFLVLVLAVCGLLYVL